MPDIKLSVLPTDALFAFLTELMKVIQKAQDAFIAAPPEYRERAYARIDRWETFWMKVAEPLYKLVVDPKEQ